MYTTYFIEICSNSKYWKEIVNESPPSFFFFFGKLRKFIVFVVVEVELGRIIIITFVIFLFRFQL